MSARSRKKRRSSGKTQKAGLKADGTLKKGYYYAKGGGIKKAKSK